MMHKSNNFDKVSIFGLTSLFKVSFTSQKKSLFFSKQSPHFGWATFNNFGRVYLADRWNEAVAFVIGKERVLEYWSQG